MSSAAESLTDLRIYCLAVVGFLISKDVVGKAKTFGCVSVFLCKLVPGMSRIFGGGGWKIVTELSGIRGCCAALGPLVLLGCYVALGPLVLLAFGCDLFLSFGEMSDFSVETSSLPVSLFIRMSLWTGRLVKATIHMSLGEIFVVLG